MGSSSAPLVSFVVPCYNYGRYLPDCLTSIFQQDDAYDFEIVAIDDGSTDNTAEVLRSFADPRLRVITHAVNCGHVATINEGLHDARGEFVARIDPDDRYRSYFLSTTLAKFQAFPEVGLVYGDAALMNDRGEIDHERSDEVHGGQDFKGNEFLQLLQENSICAPTAIARREAWQRALPVPNGLAFNDWYFNLMIARQFDFYYVAQVLADYRVHPANHHRKIVRDKSEEASVFRLLDGIFDDPEKRADLEAHKQRIRRRVYAAQYLRMAEKYFGFHMDTDARRCYLKALFYRPACMARPGPFRRLLATYLGRTRYESWKALYRSLRSKLGLASS